MIKLLSVVLFALPILSSPARGETEFPYLEAHLVEITRSGQEISDSAERRLTANRFRDSKSASSFTFREVFGPPPCHSGICQMRPTYLRSRNFKVVRVTQDRCGSRRYLAQGDKAQLTVLDHDSQHCDRYLKNRWEVKLVEADQKRPRLFEGNPEPLFVAETCQEKLANWVCNMIYFPVDCRAETADGGKTPIAPLSAHGSNACFAGIQIKQAACLGGIDPDRFEEGDIICQESASPDPLSRK